MSVQKLERVLWRVRKRNPNKQEVTWIELKRAIMYECGTDPKTYKNNKKALTTLQWIKASKFSKQRVVLTDKDL